MGFREQDGLPYRSAVTEAAAKTPVPYSTDEANFDTLQAVSVTLAIAIEGLSKGFNAFDVLSAGTDKAKIDHMMRIIAGNQIAYDILAPLLEQIDSAIGRANDNYKKRNSQ